MTLDTVHVLPETASSRNSGALSLPGLGQVLATRSHPEDRVAGRPSRLVSRSCRVTGSQWTPQGPQGLPGEESRASPQQEWEVAPGRTPFPADPAREDLVTLGKTQQGPATGQAFPCSGADQTLPLRVHSAPSAVPAPQTPTFLPICQGETLFSLLSWEARQLS